MLASGGLCLPTKGNEGLYPGCQGRKYGLHVHLSQGSLSCVSNHLSVVIVELAVLGIAHWKSGSPTERTGTSKKTVLKTYIVQSDP